MVSGCRRNNGRSGIVEQLWAEQHILDQQPYRDAYRKIAASTEMNGVREEFAVRAAIAQIAKESGITYEEAKALYWRIQDRQRGQLGSGQRSNW
jgi:hypothetical protein